jgi:hypothetical protein
VRFSDEVGIDMGGPRREFLSAFLKYGSEVVKHARQVEGLVTEDDEYATMLNDVLAVGIYAGETDG